MTSTNFCHRIYPHASIYPHAQPSHTGALMNCVSTHNSVNLGLASLFYFQQVSLPLYTN